MKSNTNTSSIETPTTTLVSSESHTLMTGALRRVLRPLVYLMLSRKMSYPYITELLKELFVEVAESDFKINSKRQTDARITLLTGVHRKDVKRLRGEATDAGEVVPENISLGAQLIAAWSANPAYTDAYGHTKPLPRFYQEGGENSFEALVKSVSKDIHPRAVLDEWLRLGVAAIDDQNYVHLTTDAFVPEEGFAEKTYYFAQNLHDHVAAASSNVLGGKPPFLERSVYYDGLSHDAIVELSEIAEKQGMHALRAVNSRASERLNTDPSSGQPAKRMTFGIYFYHEPHIPSDSN